MTNCIFCKIINGDIPSYIVYEDEQVLAFLDISQTTKGHTLVIPKSHAKNFAECDDNDLNKVMGVAKKIANSLLKTGAKGVNILSNINEVAGQSVFHFHVHVIPRYNENDTIKISFVNNNEKYKDEMQNIATLIKNNL